MNIPAGGSSWMCMLKRADVRNTGTWRQDYEGFCLCGVYVIRVAGESEFICVESSFVFWFYVNFYIKKKREKNK